MKTMKTLLLLVAAVTIFSLIIIACDNGTSSVSSEKLEPLKITGTTDGGKAVRIEFSNNPLETGYGFKIWIDGQLVSEGTIIVDGSNITFVPNNGGEFYGTWGNSELNIAKLPPNSTIFYQTGKTEPGTGGGGGGSRPGSTPSTPATPPTPPAITYTVTFNSNGGSAIAPMAGINENAIITPPTAPTKTFTAVAGLYEGDDDITHEKFIEWQLSGAAFVFATTPITGDITLEAVWTAPVRITAVAANNVDAALTYVNSNAASSPYTLAIDTNLSIAGSTTRGLDTAGAELKIVGLGSERKISLTSQGRIFTVGASGQNDIKLTLGENITLEGFATNNNSVVRVQNGATFTMETGSRITGNVSDGTALPAELGNGAAVYVKGDSTTPTSSTTFTMTGGSITGNTATANDNRVVGGLFANNNGNGNTDRYSISLEGGSIIGNSSSPIAGDITLHQTPTPNNVLDLSGTAVVGNITLYCNTTYGSDSNTRINIASGWTGTVAQINLLGDVGLQSSAVTYWVNKTVLTGTLTTPMVDNFNLILGYLFWVPSLPPTSNTLISSLTPARAITNSGANIGKFQ